MQLYFRTYTFLCVLKQSVGYPVRFLQNPDPGDPKRPDPDPDPSYKMFNKPYYVWDVLTLF